MSPIAIADAPAPSAAVSKLTLDEKISLLSGRTFCDTAEIQRLSIPSVKVSDGPSGCRGQLMFDALSSAVFPNSSSLASTWNPDLIESVGVELGHECKLKSVQTLLAPTVNLHRDPRGGRNFECYSEDPIHTAVIAAAYVKGIQSTGVGTCVKHLVCNERETRRKLYDVEISEKALREVYLRTWEIIIKEAQPWSVMTAYNDLNGKPCSEHDEVIRIVREEFGFEGMVMSDWFGTKDGVRSLTAGMDLEMPFPVHRRRQLPGALAKGEVSEEVVDRAVQRMLQWIKQTNPPLNRPEERPFDNNTHRMEVARQAATEGLVLLRNDQNVLPLRKTPGSKLAVIGYFAQNPTLCGGGSASVEPPYRTIPLETIRKAAPEVEVTHHAGVPIWRIVPVVDKRLASSIQFTLFNKGEEKPVYQGKREKSAFSLLDEKIPALGDQFTIELECEVTAPTTGRYVLGVFAVGTTEIFVDGKSLATFTPAHMSTEQFIFNRFDYEERFELDLTAGKTFTIKVVSQSKTAEGFEPAPQGLNLGLTEVIDEDAEIAGAVEIARSADQVVLFTGLNGEWESEGSDRADIHLPRSQEKLVKAVLAVRSDVVLVNQSGSAIDLEFCESIHGIVQAFLGGMEGGNAIADTLFGDANPSGRLSMTFPKRLEDHASYESFTNEVDGRLVYTEDIEFGYRSYEKNGVEPAYPFGFGLSYTDFDWSASKLVSSDPAAAVVTTTVTNAGTAAGRDVVQLYLSPPGGTRKLATFGKTPQLEAGASHTLTLSIDKREFESWNGSGWEIAPGKWTVSLCRNARDVEWTAEIAL